MSRLTKLSTKITAFILMFVILFMALPLDGYSLLLESGSKEEGTLPESSDHAEDHEALSVLHNGAKKTYVDLSEDGKETFTAFVTGIKPQKRTWQILIPGENKWVNIYGCTS